MQDLKWWNAAYLNLGKDYLRIFKEGGNFITLKLVQIESI